MTKIIGIRREDKSGDFEMTKGFLLDNMLTEEEYDKQNKKKQHEHKILFFNY